MLLDLLFSLNMDLEIYHKGIPCFFSIGFRYDHQVLSHVNNQRHEAYVREYQLEQLLFYPMVYVPPLSSSHKVNTCNAESLSF